MGSAWQEIKELHRVSTFGAKEGFAFRYFSRPLASFILYFIKDGKITPNQVTILSLLVGIVGSIVHMTVLTYGGLLIGCALFMLAHVLDALDGQLARHRKAGSVVGMYFDFFIDELKAYLMYVALGLRLYWTRDESLGWVYEQLGIEHPDATLYALIIGFAGLAVGISCTQFVKRAEWKEAFPPPAPPEDGAPAPAPGGAAAVIALIEKVGHFVVDYPSYIVFVCVINHVEIYFVAYSLVVVAYALRSLAQISLKLWRIDPYSKAE